MRFDAHQCRAASLSLVLLLAMARSISHAAQEEPAEPPAPQSEEKTAPEQDAGAVTSEAPPAPEQPTDEPPAQEKPPADKPADEAPKAEVTASDQPADDKPAEKSAPDKTATPTEPEPSADAPPVEPQAPIEAASFNGVRPGHTKRDELHKKWGEPERIDRIPGGVRETYISEPFEHVRVTVLDDLVDSLTLKLAAPMAVGEIVERLHVSDVVPVEVFDPQGQLLGHAFPERGMMLGLEPGVSPPRVTQIVIAKVDEQAFLARAEVRMSTHYADSLADARLAVRLAPENGRAHWVCAEVLLLLGDYTHALESARKAVELEPEELEYRLTVARILCETGDYRHAIGHARDVAEASGTPPLLVAKAYCRWGQCVAAAPERNYKEALEHHQRAIKLAEPLAGGTSAEGRRAAKEVLLEAYLGAAHAIGHGDWQQQALAVPKWLDKALAVADDLVEHERADAQARLQVHVQALAALAGIARPPDATRWINGTTQLGAIEVRQAADPAHKARLAWQLGVGLADATEIETARGKPQRALQVGSLAMKYFELGDAAGKQLPTHDYLRGWLCYRMGAIHAISHRDHKQAVAWFAHAVPLLEHPVPASAAVNTARVGETFVSMAVSYWEDGNRPEALRLTEQGLQWMERASSDGKLEKSALAVPYGNLARMHQLEGDEQKAKQYAELAARAKAMPAK